MRARRSVSRWHWALAATLAAAAFVAHAQRAPELVFDPTWPKDLPNNWKLGGITGLALDRDENIWLYNRPNDLTNIELHAELDPPLALCCVRAPSMIHLDRAGRVIGSFDAPQGHGMDVDSEGFVYLGQDTVRKYDPRTGEVVAEIARAPEREDGGPVGLQPVPRRTGQGGRGPVAAFLPQPPPDPAAVEAQAARRAAFRAKYPPATPMIVGQLEEIRIVEADNEVYVADSYLGGRVLVFALDTFDVQARLGRLRQAARRHQHRRRGPPLHAERPDAARLRRPSDDQRVARRPRLRGRPQREPHSRDAQGRRASSPNGCSRRARASAARRAASRSRPTRSSACSTSPISRTIESGS